MADIEELNQRITVYEEKLKLLNEQSGHKSGASGSGNESEVSSDLLQGQIVDLKSQVNALRNENIKMKETLAKEKQAQQQFKQLADSAEKQLLESNSVTKDIRESHQRELEALKGEKAQLEEKLREAERSAASKDDVTNGANLSEQLEAAKSQLQAKIF